MRTSPEIQHLGVRQFRSVLLGSPTKFKRHKRSFVFLWMHVAVCLMTNVINQILKNHVFFLLYTLIIGGGRNSPGITEEHRASTFNSKLVHDIYLLTARVFCVV